MKVLHVVPSVSRSYGGPTEALCAYASASIAVGVHVEIIAPNCSNEDVEWISARLPGVPLHLHPSMATGAFALAPSLLAWVARQERFDIVHVHGTLNAVSSLAALICRARRWPYVVRPFGTLSRYTILHRRTAFKRLYFHGVDRHVILGASGLHFTTEQEQDDASWRGLSLPRSFVIPPPFYAAAPSGLRQRPNDDRTDSPQVLFLSRLHPVKNLEALLDAWTFVLADSPRARLIIAGQGEAAYVRSLQRRIAMREGRNIEFRGFVTGDEKAALLGNADVFVLPSHHENFGIAALEAIAAGVPVVVTPDVQLSRFIAAHRLGNVVEKRPEAIALGIINAIRDSGLRTRCKSDGRSIVENAFAPAVIGRQLQDMYFACMGAGTGDTG